jgi:hypothetical protein
MSMNPKTRTFLARTVLAAAALVSGAALAGDIKPFTAEYQANYMGIQGNGRMILASTGGDQWRYSLEIDGTMAALKQSTVFDAHGGQFRPLSNTDTSSVLIKRKVKNAVYDWGKGEARWTGDVKPERAGPVKLQAGDLDAMLINLAIIRDSAAGKPLRYRMVDDGRVKQLNYTVAGKEAITIAGRSEQATKITRTDGDKQEVMWVVDDMPVPVRILRRKGGEDEVDLRLKSVH